MNNLQYIKGAFRRPSLSFLQKFVAADKYAIKTIKSLLIGRGISCLILIRVFSAFPLKATYLFMLVIVLWADIALLSKFSVLVNELGKIL